MKQNEAIPRIKVHQDFKQSYTSQSYWKIEWVQKSIGPRTQCIALPVLVTEAEESIV